MGKKIIYWTEISIKWSLFFGFFWEVADKWLQSMRYMDPNTFETGFGQLRCCSFTWHKKNKKKIRGSHFIFCFCKHPSPKKMTKITKEFPNFLKPYHGD